MNYTRKGYDHINVKDLVNDDDLGSGAEFYDKIDSLVRHAIDSRIDIYFDGLNGKMHVEQYGAWQMFHSLRETTRDDLREFLAARYRIDQLTGVYNGRLLSVTDAQAEVVP